MIFNPDFEYRTRLQLCRDLVYFTTQVPDTSDTSATWVRHECDTSATRTTRVRHKWKILILITRQLKTFSHTSISYMANERLPGEEQLHSKNCLLDMHCSHAKMRLKSAPQKLNFVIEKAISKIYTLHCNCKYLCTFPHSYSLVVHKNHCMWNSQHCF